MDSECGGVRGRVARQCPGESPVIRYLSLWRAHFPSIEIVRREGGDRDRCPSEAVGRRSVHSRRMPSCAGTSTSSCTPSGTSPPAWRLERSLLPPPGREEVRDALCGSTLRVSSAHLGPRPRKSTTQPDPRRRRQQTSTHPSRTGGPVAWTEPTDHRYEGPGRFGEGGSLEHIGVPAPASSDRAACPNSPAPHGCRACASPAVSRWRGKRY